MLRMSSVTVHVLLSETTCETRDSFLDLRKNVPYPIRLLIKKLFLASNEGFKIASCVASQTRYLHSIQIWRVTRWALFLFKHLRTVLVEPWFRHMQCAQSPMRLIDSTAMPASSRLHSSMNFGSRN